MVGEHDPLTFDGRVVLIADLYRRLLQDTTSRVVPARLLGSRASRSRADSERTSDVQSAPAPQFYGLAFQLRITVIDDKSATSATALTRDRSGSDANNCGRILRAMSRRSRVSRAR